MGHILQDILNFSKRPKPIYTVSSPPRSDYSDNYNIDEKFDNQFDLNLRKTIVWAKKLLAKLLINVDGR